MGPCKEMPPYTTSPFEKKVPQTHSHQRLEPSLPDYLTFCLAELQPAGSRVELADNKGVQVPPGQRAYKVQSINSHVRGSATQLFRTLC